MSRTYTQIRQLTAKATRLYWRAGTAASSGSSVAILRDAELTRYGDDYLNGMHILLTSGSPTYTELHIKDFFSDNGDCRFEPELSAAPDSLTYEILPFSGTDFLEAIQLAALQAYDRGYLARTHWSRVVGGSPIYNADWSYWTSSSQPDGWTITTATAAKEVASENISLSETALELNTAAGYASLDAQWQRYLDDLKGETITFCCPVKTSAASNARINLNNGSDNYSAYHGGGGDWELLSVEVNTSKSDSAIQPRLYIDTTSTAYFGIPFLLHSANPIRTYPFTIETMPDGPYSITTAMLDVELDDIASGRGRVATRQLGRQRQVLSPRVLKHHDENATSQVGVLDFSLSPRVPGWGMVMWLRGDGPLTIPTSVVSTDSLELNYPESLLLASMAARNLFERGGAGQSPHSQRVYSERRQLLDEEIAVLARGVGEQRDVATYSLGW